MTIRGRFQHGENYQYTMRSPSSPVKMERSAAKKDLGIIVVDRLTFGEEIANRAKKGRQIAAIIRRTFTYLDEEMFGRLFKALVRPHLEYAAAVWAPHLKKDIRELEDVQRRASKQIPTLKGMDYPGRLKRLKLPTLQHRRRRGDQIEIYKILTGLYDIQPSKFFNIATNDRQGGTARSLRRSEQEHPNDSTLSVTEP
jgi:hypothetical protein